MGLNTNSGKTVNMTCRPCDTTGNRSEEAYGRLMTVEGHTFRERKIEGILVQDNDGGKGGWIFRERL